MSKDPSKVLMFFFHNKNNDVYTLLENDWTIYTRNLGKNVINTVGKNLFGFSSGFVSFLTDTGHSPSVIGAHTN